MEQEKKIDASLSISLKIQLKNQLKGKGQGKDDPSPLSPLPFNAIMDVLPNAVRQKRKTKGI